MPKYVNTADATATPTDIRDGETAYVKGELITGTQKFYVEGDTLHCPSDWYVQGNTLVIPNSWLSK